MAGQQSWANWLLGTYTSIVSTGSTTQSQGGESTKTSSNSQPRNSISSSLPYGPYVRTGRGGAGNFVWQNQELVQDPNDNLEAQSPSTLNEQRRAAENIEHHDTEAAVKAKAAQRPSSQYIRVGRGYISTDEIQQSSQLTDTDARSSILPTTKTPLVAHPGRGGAGNHAAAAELNRLIENENAEKERTRVQKTRERVEEQVQNTLPAPPGAWLGGRPRNADLPKRHD